MGFIAESRRQNLWFGTEDRMEWFKTPSTGADTSPMGWDSEGTTLNGGGYVFNSFGSHKQYQFDWGSSNARVVAQKMKSYADGSYGRGYIYFVDPTIYDHNVLPAHWADPSMGIDYEGNSIVAGVDPVGIPTGANSNDLPVQAAQFNLNTIPVGFRGKAQAVYVPIPEGHTLSLGAMYSFTGSGGVFASPVLLTGAIAAPQKLTTLGVNTPNIVADTFSGVRGVWLWVGKTAAGNSTVTIHGLIGRLMTDAEATSHTIAENLFTNPELVGDGTWAEVRRNLATNPSFETSVSGWSIQEVTTTRSDEWASSGEYSMKVEAKGGPNSSTAYRTLGSLGAEVGKTYTVLVRQYLPTPLTGTLNARALTVSFAGIPGVGGDNSPGERWLRYTFTVDGVAITPSSILALYNGSGVAGEAVYYDDFMFVEGEYDGPYFDGNTTPETAGDIVQPEDFRWRWLGAENASESVMEIERVRGLVAFFSIAGVSTREGKPAVRHISLDTNAAAPSSRFHLPFVADARSSGTVLSTLHVDEPLSGVLSSNSRRVNVLSPSSVGTQAPNLPGSYDMRRSYAGLTSNYLAQMWHGGLVGSPDVWWTDIGLFAGIYDGPAFSGSSPQNGTTHYRWTGAIDNSTSEAYYVSSKSVEQKLGPWVGGMGHSGCRFVGKPTFIENGPDWTGFSATFKEVVN